MGTFHTYSENVLTNGIAAVALGGRRRMNRLHVRIAVSEAAAWTARRFYGGRYRIVPNGVHLPRVRAATAAESSASAGAPLRILFVGQAVERKGLPVLLRAFEALREHVPATLTLVGASARGGRAHDARRPWREGARQGLRGAQARGARRARRCCARRRCTARASAWC